MANQKHDSSAITKALDNSKEEDGDDLAIPGETIEQDHQLRLWTNMDRTLWNQQPAGMKYVYINSAPCRNSLRTLRFP